MGLQALNADTTFDAQSDFVFSENSGFAYVQS